MVLWLVRVHTPTHYKTIQPFNIFGFSCKRWYHIQHHLSLSITVMQDLQSIFNRLEESKKQLKDIRRSYKEALENVQSYVELGEELKVLREKKKQIETTVRQEFSGEFMKMEDLKIDIASDMELISDIAMSQIMKGDTVEITDKYENDYEPVIKVTFKKVT